MRLGKNCCRVEPVFQQVELLATPRKLSLKAQVKRHSEKNESEFELQISSNKHCKTSFEILCCRILSQSQQFHGTRILGSFLLLHEVYSWDAGNHRLGVAWEVGRYTQSRPFIIQYVGIALRACISRYSEFREYCQWLLTTETVIRAVSYLPNMYIGSSLSFPCSSERLPLWTSVLKEKAWIFCFYKNAALPFDELP